MAIVGAGTLLLAGFIAITLHDIKRVLAHSTVSQIGYMFPALGVGAWQAAMFHFVTHAFFKELPVAFWTFLIGGCSLAGLPFITAFISITACFV